MIEIGTRFGKLRVLEVSHKGNDRRYYYKCICDCGNIVIVRSNSLTSGNTKSCGCARFGINKKHGMKNTRIYRIWSNMKDRCLNPNNNAFERYGSRGVGICKEWQDDFINFYNWAMESGYKDDLTIDRIDNNRGYEPCNCRWATPKQQSDNKRNNILINIDGEIKDLQEWCDFYGIKRSTVNTRVRVCGWDYKTAITTKVRPHKEYIHKI